MPRIGSGGSIENCRDEGSCCSYAVAGFAAFFAAFFGAGAAFTTLAAFAVLAAVTRALVAYQRPLSQVLALDAAPAGVTPSAAPVAADDKPVDIKAVFTRIWEVLS